MRELIDLGCPVQTQAILTETEQFIFTVKQLFDHVNRFLKQQASTWLGQRKTDEKYFLSSSLHYRIITESLWNISPFIYHSNYPSVDYFSDDFSLSRRAYGITGRSMCVSSPL